MPHSRVRYFQNTNRGYFQADSCALIQMKIQLKQKNGNRLKMLLVGLHNYSIINICSSWVWNNIIAFVQLRSFSLFQPSIVKRHVLQAFLWWPELKALAGFKPWARHLRSGRGPVRPNLCTDLCCSPAITGPAYVSQTPQSAVSDNSSSYLNLLIVICSVH